MVNKMFEFLLPSIFEAIQAQKRIGGKTKRLSYPSDAICRKIRRHLLRNGGWSILLCYKLVAPMGMRNPRHFMSLILLRFNRIPQLKLLRQMSGSKPVFHPNRGILLSKPNKGLEHKEDEDLEYGDLIEYFISLLHKRPIFHYASLGNNTPILRIVMHPSGRFFFMGCYDIRGTHSLVCYHFGENDTVVTHTILSGHRDSVYAIAVHQNGRFMVSASSDNQGILWEISANGARISDVINFDFCMCVLCLEFHPEEMILAAGGLCSDVTLWQIEPIGLGLIKISDLIGHSSYVHDVKILKERLVTASADNTIKIWGTSSDFRKNVCLRTLQAHRDRVLSLCLHPIERIMVSGSSDNTGIVWWLSDDNSSATQIQVLDGLSSFKNVLFDPSGTHLVSSDSDCTSVVWE
jgi:hypothetical protein